MITKKAEYAVIILTELAAHPLGTTITSKDIAARRSIPVNLVVQLLAVLKEAGWTEGTRGPTGGIRLITDPHKINLRAVIEAVDGPIGITRCLFSSKPCRDQQLCSLRGIWSRAQQEMLKVLEEATIKELAAAAALEC
ncbi:MAG: Rrf2 family transcriptional regulator [Firmicutes bacterium]|nr:Rrf2 family transcriptional regulator [Bacillota bacterium]